MKDGGAGCVLGAGTGRAWQGLGAGGKAEMPFQPEEASMPTVTLRLHVLLLISSNSSQSVRAGALPPADHRQDTAARSTQTWGETGGTPWVWTTSQAETTERGRGEGE